MDSPSRNPLLLEQTNERDSSADESNDEETEIGAGVAVGSYVGHAAIKPQRSSSTPTDRYNFAYIVFYFLGM
jgi:hypothetical protein